MKEAVTPRDSAAQLGDILSERVGERRRTNGVRAKKTMRQSAKKGEQWEVEEEKQIGDAEMRLRKLEGKRALHHLSRAKPRREIFFFFNFTTVFLTQHWSVLDHLLHFNVALKKKSFC